MANMHDCIETAIRMGEIPEKDGRAAQTAYAQLKERYATIMPEGQAASRAAQDIKEATTQNAKANFHRVINQMQAMERIRHLVETTPDAANALAGFLRQAEGHGFKGESIQSLTEAYQDMARSKLDALLNDVGLNVIGSSRNTARLENIVKEAFGEDTGDLAAKAHAKAFVETENDLIRSFNAYGGDVKILKNRGLTQTHDADLMRKAGFNAWADTIEPLLDWARITDFATGKGFAATRGEIPPRLQTERFLKDVYESRTTLGWDDRDPSMSFGGTALYNRRADHRVLHFKSGTAQLAYNKAFGSTDPFSSMINGLNSLARDVALMRVLGPNPKLGLEYAIQVAQKKAALAGDTKLESRIQSQAYLARSMLHHAAGASTVQYEGWANFMAGTRAFAASAQLGSAVLSSVTDVATITVAAQHIGMSSSNVLATSVALLKAGATRETAARMGYVAETLATTGGGSARYFGKVFGTGITERMAGFTLRATGLTQVTDWRKIAFQQEFAGFLAEHADRSFDQLPKPLRRIFENRDISARDWDALRHPDARFRADNGADFIAPMYWLEKQTAMPRAEAEGLAMRLQMVAREQLEYAVPTTSLEGRALWLGETARGTVGGELLQSSLMYKSFGLSLFLNQYRRFMAIDSGWDRAAYAAKLSTLLIGTAALAIQLKELAKGNDPRPMTDGKFWMAALMQSGGLGIFGDFFASEQNRIGGGIAQTLAGPVVSLASDVLGPFASNITAAIAGKKTHWGTDAVNLLRHDTPFLSSAFYARTAHARLVADTMQRFFDPEAEKSFRDRLRKQRNDYDNDAYWAPGSPLPTRAPDLSNIMGAR